MKKQNKMKFKEMDNETFKKFSELMIDNFSNKCYIDYGFNKALDEVEKIIDDNSIGIKARTFANIKRKIKELRGK